MKLNLVLRNLGSNYKLTILVFTSLVMGITCSIIIYSKISYELSFDNYHSHSKNTYRVVRVTSGLEYLNGGLEYRTGVYFPLPDEIRKTIPENRDVSAMFYWQGGTITFPKNDKTESKEFNFNSGIVFTEPSFFKIFDFGEKGLKWIKGEEQVLSEPFVAVLTEGTANRLFLDQNPIDKIFSLNGQFYTVGGIIEDLPQNTDFPFQIILSLSTFTEKLYPGAYEDWGSLSDNYQCYVVLNDKSNVAQVETKFKDIYADHASSDEANWRTFKLQPLNQVHKESKFGNYNNHTISGGLILAISMIGIFIFLIACFNYGNFFLAETLKKEKQIAVRLIMGGKPFNIILQFLFESLIVTSIALLISLLLSYNLIKTFYAFIDIPEGYFPPFNLKLLLFILTLLLAGSILSVLFSAFSLKYKSLFLHFKKTIKGNSGDGVLFRKGSVILQFIVAQVVIISTLFILKQINFINNTDLGYDTENIIVASLPNDSQNKLDVLSEELKSSPGVEKISFSSNTPAEAYSWSGFSLTRNGEQLNIDAEIKYIDSTYIDLYSLKILSGQNFSEKKTSYILVNREFVSETGFDNPDDALGTFVAWGGTQMQIKGVVEDFHSGSLREAIRPCVLYNDPVGFNTVNIKLLAAQNKTKGNKKPSNKLIDNIKEKWQTIFAGEVFEYTFFDYRISNYYQSEHKAFNLFILLASITIFLCILGILGLSLSMNERRTKEIGIRKVNGAKISEILTMLNKDFVKWVIIAFVIATPIAYFAMNKWLENFAYKTTLSWWIFALAGFLALGIALLTVSWQSWRAATRNPVEALRYE